MIRIIRRELLQEYEQRRFHHELEARQHLKKLYEQIPEFEKLESSYKKMELEILKNVFASPSLAESAAQEQAKLHARKKKDREELLLRHDIHHNPFEPQYTCPKCKDSAYLENGNYCDCFRIELAERIYRLSGAVAKARRDLKSYSLDVFIDKPQYEDMKGIVKDIKEEAATFRQHPGRNYVFTGGVSLGKTFLMESFAGELLKKGIIVYSVTAPGFVDFLRRYRFQGRPEPEDDQIYQLLMESDLLLLDDLGKENPTEYVQTEFFNLVNQRYLNNKSLFISTNLSIRELFEVYGDANMSRILGGAYVAQFSGTLLPRGE